MRKRILSAILTICMVLIMIPMTAFAETSEVIGSGDCGTGVTWTLTNDWVLTISGSGDMNNYWNPDDSSTSWEKVPWLDSRESITHVTIEEGVTSVGSYAFNGCVNVKEIELPEHMSELGVAVFAGCSQLNRIEIPSGIKVIYSSTFNGCSGLQEVVLPESITNIGANSFKGCSGLQQIVLPENVTEIGFDAFSGCSSLQEVVIPGGVTEIESNVFKGCSSLQRIVIPSGMEKIGAFAFDGCSGLQEIDIPESVKNIEYYAFCGCSGLQEIVLPEGLTRIEQSTFSRCGNLKRIVIPESVTGIGKSAFYGCGNLQEIILPEGLTEIGEDAFSLCESLKEIILPKGLTEIMESTFYQCNSLQEIILPESVTGIGKRAFYQCESLKEITIPYGVTRIEDYTFYFCSALQKVMVPLSVESISENAFDRGNKISFIGAKGSAIETYANQNGFKFTEHEHEWDNGDKSDLSCAEINYVTYSCVGCGAVEEREVIAAHEVILAEDISYTCTGTESVAFYKCAKCRKYFRDESSKTEINPEEIAEITAHNIVKVEGKKETCEEDGRAAYYKCEKCGKSFRDAEGLEEIDVNDTVIEKTGHSIVKVDKKAATCAEDGNIEHYKCENCGKTYRDAGGTEEINADDVLVERFEHSIVWVERKAATCAEYGNYGHYKCENCKKLFRDDDGTEEISAEDIIIEKSRHFMGWIAEKPVTCEKDGNIECYQCMNCEKLYRDIEGKEELSLEDVIVEKTGHNIQKILEKAPTCKEDGNIECYGCVNCGKIFRDAKGTEEVSLEDVTIKATGHSFVFVEGKPATCEEDGVVRHYECENCGKLFLDASDYFEITEEDIKWEPKGHRLKHVWAVRVSCEFAGNPEYYHCEVCNKNFSDAYGKHPIQNVVLNPIGHKYSMVTRQATFYTDGEIAKVCQNCGRKIVVEKYYNIDSVELSKTECPYSGKIQAPKVIVEDCMGDNIPAANYTVSYSNKKSKNIGKYTVTVTFNGERYSGSKVLTYTIVPPNVKLSSVSAKESGKLTVKWAKKKGVNGYQIRYSKKSNMKGSKTKTIKGAKKHQYTITKLTKGKKYYVQVRSYKNVSGKPYYGVWSKKKSARTLNIRLNYTSLSMEPGQTRVLKLKDAKQSVSWNTSNASVANVNSAGMVTAVAEGTATITATCGGSSYSCAVTVRTSTGFDKLYDYITNYGDMNSSGDRFIRYTFYDGQTYWKAGIVYERATGQFEFICTNSDHGSIAMKIGRNGSTTTKCEFLFAGSVFAACNATAYIDIPNYNDNTTLNFAFVDYIGATRETYNGLANAMLKVSMEGWNILLKKDVGISMTDLGFANYH